MPRPSPQEEAELCIILLFPRRIVETKLPLPNPSPSPKCPQIPSPLGQPWATLVRTCQSQLRQAPKKPFISLLSKRSALDKPILYSLWVNFDQVVETPFRLHTTARDIGSCATEVRQRTRHANTEGSVLRRRRRRLRPRACLLRRFEASTLRLLRFAIILLESISAQLSSFSLSPPSTPPPPNPYSLPTPPLPPPHDTQCTPSSPSPS
jgi:hypothetical protein